MPVTDPIADLCTRVRNATMRRHPQVLIPFSRMKQNILEVMKDEGFIKTWEVKEVQSFAQLAVQLKYDQGESVIRTIKRVSRPGRRVHAKVSDIHPILNGQGIAIVTTSKGVFSDRRCRELKMGGEVLCHIW